MARLPYLEKADLAAEHRDLLKRDIALHKLLAHSPGASRAFQGLGQYIRHGSTLDPRLRELAILQVGYLARSPYEWSHHIKIGTDFGVSDADIAALIDDTEGRPAALDAPAKLVLRAAREITRDGGLSDASYAALAAVLSHEHLVDLIVTIGFYTAVVRVLASIAIDVEPEYQQYLERYPLPPDAENS
jgi:alkylhydroperoxidase family enzyme